MDSLQREDARLCAPSRFLGGVIDLLRSIIDGRGGIGVKRVWLMGAVGYPCLEMLWRGRTHPAMALAGGAGLAALCRCARGRGEYLRRVAKGACAVTGIEYLTGRLFNRRYTIWDYRGRWGNLQGQICPAYFCAWAGIAAVVTALLKKPANEKEPVSRPL